MYKVKRVRSGDEDPVYRYTGKMYDTHVLEWIEWLFDTDQFKRANLFIFEGR